MAAREEAEAVQKGVRFDEGAVQIDAKRRLCANRDGRGGCVGY
jgi:hypothetical protein